MIIGAIDPLRFILLGHPKTQGLCERAVWKGPPQLKDAPGHFQTQKMCDKAVDCNPWQLEYVPNHFKTQEMCDKEVDDSPWMLGALLIILKPGGCATSWWIGIYTY